MQTPHTTLDAAAVLAAIRERRAVARRRTTWGKSRLVPYRAELVKLRKAGGSFADLREWLRLEKRVKVDTSTVRRYLQKLPEMAEPKEGDRG